MSFTFRVSPTSFEVRQDQLTVLEKGHFSVYFAGISGQKVLGVIDAYHNNNLKSFLHALTENRFVIFFYDSKKGKFLAINDKFGNNEIYIQRDGNGYSVSSDVSSYADRSIEATHVYEFLTFQVIAAPRTIFKNIEIVPTAQMLVLDAPSSCYSFETYWSVESFFNNKSTDYENHVSNLRDAFLKELAVEYGSKTAVSLSGGIDSGGILGMLSEQSGAPVNSVSFGPQGINSQDLVSARKTIYDNSSINTEVYPSTQMFLNLFDIAPNLSQPVSSDFSLATSEIYREAGRRGFDKIYLGYGAQMLLGNLLLNKLWHKSRLIEKILPSSVQGLLNQTFVNIKGYSQNTRALLDEKDWATRMFYVQGALYTRECELYLKKRPDFIEYSTDYLRPIMDMDMGLSDRFVWMHFSSWMNYAQQRHNTILGKMFGITPFSPFNTDGVAKVLFATPDSFRRVNDWDKQVLRDMFKPYVSDYLYKRKGASLLVPYTKVFNDALSYFLPYLKKQSLICDLIDLDLYTHRFSSLPEPGLHLVRLLGLGIWHDSHYGNSSADNLKELIVSFNFEKKMASIVDAK